MISPYFTDSELETQLRMQFDDEEMWDTDLKPFLNHIVDRGADFYLEFRGRRFSIDKMTGTVTELKT